MSMSHNKKLLYSITTLLLVISIRLFFAGEEQNNWEGVWFSILQLVVVGVTAYFGLRKTENPSNQ